MTMPTKPNLLAAITNVTLAVVRETDNQGEQCQHCQIRGHVNVVTVYFRDEMFGHLEDGESDCCLHCLPQLMAKHYDVRAVEISTSVTIAPF